MVSFCVYILPCNEAISFFSVIVHSLSWQKSLDPWLYAFQSECCPTCGLITQSPAAHLACLPGPALCPRLQLPHLACQGTSHPKFLYRKTGFMDLVEICCALWVVGEGGCLLFTLDGRAPERVSVGRDPKGVSLQNLLCYWTKPGRRCDAQRAPGRRLNQSCVALVFMKHLNSLQVHN